MKNQILKITTLIVLIAFSNLGKSQFTVVPNNINTGTDVFLTFSGLPAQLQNASCVVVMIQQGTQTIYEMASSTFVQGTNTFTSYFYLASDVFTGTYTISFLDCNTYSSIISYANKLTIKAKASINQISEWFDFSIFPNPVSKGEPLNIVSKLPAKQALSSCQIYNMDGRVIYQNSNTKSFDQIKTDFLSSGEYLVQFTNNKGETLTKKLTVK